MTPSDLKATLSFNDGSPSIELPVYKGTVGPDVIDIRKLYAQMGRFTYDPGFMSTASCKSAITYIDGDKGELPNPEQKQRFKNLVTHHTMVHEQERTFFQGFPRDSHPMAILTGCVGA